MIEKTDFEKKQILFVFSNDGEKIAFKNDNIIIKTKDGGIKYQLTCYRLFALYIVGDTSITTVVIKSAQKFGYLVFLLTSGFKIYGFFGKYLEGNTVLHHKQYEYTSSDLANYIVKNKISNQRNMLNFIRDKTEDCKNAICKLDNYIDKLSRERYGFDELLGVEGAASRIYFPQIFNNVNWKGRKPRVKYDYINASLDIGYTLLFNMIDSLLRVYDFDLYCGVYHKEFYLRKSLVCDLMEPIRPLVDYKLRKAINLGQCKEDDFKKINQKYVLEYKNSPKYVKLFLETIIERKEDIFIFIQNYYRSFMKADTSNPISYHFFEV